MSFFGGGTDFPDWFNENIGAVLSTTIKNYCYLSCRHLPPFFDHNIRVVYRITEQCKTVDEIQHPVVRECLRYTQLVNGVEIVHFGDLPARSGIGSSSAFTVGLLKALYTLRGDVVTANELARNAVIVERDCVGENVGYQDQYASALGGINLITFGKGTKIAASAVHLSADRLNLLESHLLLAYVGTARTSSERQGELLSNINAHKADALLARLVQLAIDGKLLLETAEDITVFGDMLDAAWAYKKETAQHISNPAVDAFYAAAKEMGVTGGKLLGAGGGGFMLLFAKPEDHPSIKDRLRPSVFVPFRVEYDGSKVVLDNEI